jgi:hypothetical protein
MDYGFSQDETVTSTALPKIQILSYIRYSAGIIYAVSLSIISSLSYSIAVIPILIGCRAAMDESSKEATG